jgi:hypothetical protein
MSKTKMPVLDVSSGYDFFSAMKAVITTQRSTKD